MSFKKFGANDLVLNTMKAHPHNEFLIYNGALYYNSVPDQSGSRHTYVRNVPPGFVSLYEYNIDRPKVATGRYITGSIKDTGMIYPFVTKQSTTTNFSTISTTEYIQGFQYGDVVTSSYPLSASITREYITNPSSSANLHFRSLKNRLNFYGIKSKHFLVSSSLGNKNTQTLNLISVPSIFFGSQIKPGSISLKFYVSGTLAAEAKDLKRNGEIIQTGPVGSTGSGSVAGVALYDEGFLLLTGSWNLSPATFPMISGSGASVNPKWIYFGAGANDDVTTATAGGAFISASSHISFKGTTETQIMTMFAHARRGEANYSNNPTFLTYGEDQLLFTSSQIYEENPERTVANTVSSSYNGYNADFKRQVYISRIGIYDENKTLIGIATLSSPILKKEDEELSFKLKLDI
tara:strand:+ start:17512 stop:18729 length:1218 start_codon:yes stop_codon:yes gene_type:complete